MAFDQGNLATPSQARLEWETPVISTMQAQLTSGVKGATKTPESTNTGGAFTNKYAPS